MFVSDSLCRGHFQWGSWRICGYSWYYHIFCYSHCWTPLEHWPPAEERNLEMEKKKRPPDFISVISGGWVKLTLPFQRPHWESLPVAWSSINQNRDKRSRDNPQPSLHSFPTAYYWLYYVTWPRWFFQKSSAEALWTPADFVWLSWFPFK